MTFPSQLIFHDKSDCTIVALHSLSTLTYNQCKAILVSHGYLEGIGANPMMVTLAIWDIWGFMPKIRADVGTFADIGNLHKAIIFAHDMDGNYHAMAVYDGVARNTNDGFNSSSVIKVALIIE